ncbi:MAG TPA: PspA/IM30 family protein, partial [Planctomycetaceae bacterium]|nr:PspA/IM30 family protein [Planctomycetaceae bacterium]
SDIISCKLDDLIAEQGDPPGAMARIISEIEEGLAGAKRSVTAAGNSESRLRAELEERRAQAAWWGSKAREELAADHEEAARQALMRKRETEDLEAGLEQQLAAAVSTREHLSTTMRAIEARLAEARRRQNELQTPLVAPSRSPAPESTTQAPVSQTIDRNRAMQIEEELEALRRELKKG